jgi:hypothetical protein
LPARRRRKAEAARVKRNRPAFPSKKAAREKKEQPEKERNAFHVQNYSASFQHPHIETILFQYPPELSLIFKLPPKNLLVKIFFEPRKRPAYGEDRAVVWNRKTL